MSELPIETSGAEVEVHPRKTGHSRLDLILALTAIFISAVSLYVAIEHGKTERDLVAGSTWPFIGALYSNDYGDAKDVAIGITNAGVGPAKVKWVEIFYKAQPVTSNLDLLRKCCGLPADRTAAAALLPKGFDESTLDETILRPGDSAIVLGVHRVPDAPAMAVGMSQALKDISFKACYCSALDECWTGDLKTTATTRVETCPAADHPFDPDGR